MNPDLEALIDQLALKPHPEGGYYRELYRSAATVMPEDERGKRAGLTTIYFLLSGDKPSAMHKVSSDEVWHYLEGAPLEVITCDAALEKSKRTTIGAVRDGFDAEFVVPAHEWQAASSTGAWTLVCCVVAPGFDFTDFTMLRDLEREKQEFESRFPELNAFI